MPNIKIRGEGQRKMKIIHIYNLYYCFKISSSFITEINVFDRKTTFNIYYIYILYLKKQIF